MKNTPKSCKIIQGSKIQHDQSIKIINAAQSMLSASIHSFPQAQDNSQKKHKSNRSYFVVRCVAWQHCVISRELVLYQMFTCLLEVPWKKRFLREISKQSKILGELLQNYWGHEYFNRQETLFWDEKYQSESRDTTRQGNIEKNICFFF